MDDDIELPPLPPVFEWVSMAPTAKTIKEYARAAVLADRERHAFVDKKRIAELEDEVRDLLLKYGVKNKLISVQIVNLFTNKITRERRSKVNAKPVEHSAHVVLTPDGSAWSHGGAAECPPPKSTVVTLRWTDDGRAWIGGVKNRELARILRERFGATEAHAAADALDGGER